MKKPKAPTPTPPEPEGSEYIDNPEDACTDAAYKLNVVIELVQTAADRPLDADHETEDGGHGLLIAIDLLRAIRGDLRKSVAHAEKDRAAEKSGGAR